MGRPRVRRHRRRTAGLWTPWPRTLGTRRAGELARVAGGPAMPVVSGVGGCRASALVGLVDRRQTDNGRDRSGRVLFAPLVRLERCRWRDHRRAFIRTVAALARGMDHCRPWRASLRAARTPAGRRAAAARVHPVAPSGGAPPGSRGAGSADRHGVRRAPSCRRAVQSSRGAPVWAALVRDNPVPRPAGAARRGLRPRTSA